jgi:hypothetical protein
VPIWAMDVAIQRDRKSSTFKGAQASAVNRGTRALGAALLLTVDICDMIGHTRGRSTR